MILSFLGGAELMLTVTGGMTTSETTGDSYLFHRTMTVKGSSRRTRYEIIRPGQGETPEVKLQGIKKSSSAASLSVKLAVRPILSNGATTGPKPAPSNGGEELPSDAAVNDIFLDLLQGKRNVTETSGNHALPQCGSISGDCYSAHCISSLTAAQFLEGLDADAVLQSPKNDTYSSGQNATAQSRPVFQCQTSPYYAAPATPYSKQFQLECFDAPESKPIPKLPAVRFYKKLKGDSPAEFERRRSQWELQAFQHLTGRVFNKWYPWNGTCLPQPADPENDLRVSGKHERENGIYRYRNICLSPVGPLQGYFGKDATSPQELGQFRLRERIEPFDGSDDVAPLTQSQGFGESKNWLDNVVPLRAPPKCIRQTKLLIMPIILRSNNPGHVFQRLAALQDIRDHAFPGADVDGVTMAFVAVESMRTDLFDDPQDLSDWWQTAFPLFTTVVANNHFLVFGNRDDLLNKRIKKVFGDVLGSQNSDMLKIPLCFSEAAVYFTCTRRECMEARSDTGVARDIIPMYYSRSPLLLNAFTDRLRICLSPKESVTNPNLALKRRAMPNSQRPTVLFSTRSFARKWTLTPFIIKAVADYVASIGGVLKVMEMREYSTVELVNLYTGVDVVIGPYGAGLFYSIFMPPGAVAVEINLQPKGCAKVDGFNRPENKFCDYGGNFKAAGIHHLVSSWDVKEYERKSGRFNLPDFDISENVVRYLLDRALCVVNRSGYTDPNVVCPYNTSIAQQLQQEYSNDFNATALYLNYHLLPTLSRELRVSEIEAQAAVTVNNTSTLPPPPPPPPNEPKEQVPLKSTPVKRSSQLEAKAIELLTAGKPSKAKEPKVVRVEQKIIAEVVPMDLWEQRSVLFTKLRVLRSGYVLVNLTAPQAPPLAPNPFGAAPAATVPSPAAPQFTYLKQPDLRIAGWGRILLVTPCGRTPASLSVLSFLTSYVMSTVTIHTWTPELPDSHDVLCTAANADAAKLIQVPSLQLANLSTTECKTEELFGNMAYMSWGSKVAIYSTFRLRKGAHLGGCGPFDLIIAPRGLDDASLSLLNHEQVKKSNSLFVEVDAKSRNR
jgi:hypothetical protein